MESIKKTENTRNEIILKTRLITGEPVVIGERYDGMISLAGAAKNYPHKLTALRYADDKLLLANENRTCFAVLDGDFAVWEGKIITEACTTITFSQTITKETDFKDLRERYYRVPESMMKFVQIGVSGE